MEREREALRHFLNNELLAPNVLTVPVDASIVGEFTKLASSPDPGPEYCTVAPWKKFNDIRWISADSDAAFDLFKSAYERLDVARHVREYLDIEHDVRFYTGFLHTRSICKESNFHVDWIRTNNEGFTLITPICGLSDDSKLLYRKLTGEVGEYRYKLGEAIIFGDHFMHSTSPGVCSPPLTLLVFNFGTDRMKHWGKLLRTQGRQCPIVQRPDGEIMRVDPWKGPTSPEDEVEPILD
jgi:hypothetical protein